MAVTKAWKLINFVLFCIFMWEIFPQMCYGESLGIIDKMYDGNIPAEFFQFIQLLIWVINLDPNFKLSILVSQFFVNLQDTYLLS